jgi:polysaccharide biosynthesis protein PelC
MTPGRLTIPALATLAALAACGASRRTYQDSKMDFGAVRTVAVLPFQNLSNDGKAADRVRDVFANSLLASGVVYVLPPGEVQRGIERAAIGTPSAPTSEDVMKLGTILKADAVVTGVVKEYGELRSGTASSNVISVSAVMLETGTGKVVWAGATTKGGLTFGDRLFGGGGRPLNEVTEAAVDELLHQLLK